MSIPSTRFAEPSGTNPYDRLAMNEAGQVVRALEANGPKTEEELAVLVGAPYWERNRFHRALVNLLATGVLQRDGSGVIRVL